MIQYAFTRVQPYINSQNLVVGFVVGMTATDIETGTSTYIDTLKNLQEPYKTLDQYTTDEIRNICLQVANENDWYNILATQIENIKNSPKIGNNIAL